MCVCLYAHIDIYIWWYTFVYCIYIHEYYLVMCTYKYRSKGSGHLYKSVCCSVLQCVAVWCSVAVWRSALQSVAECCRGFKSVAVCSSVWQCVAVCCSVVHCTCSLHIDGDDWGHYYQGFVHVFFIRHTQPLFRSKCMFVLTCDTLTDMYIHTHVYNIRIYNMYICTHIIYTYTWIDRGEFGTLLRLTHIYKYLHMRIFSYRSRRIGASLANPQLRGNGKYAAAVCYFCCRDQPRQWYLWQYIIIHIYVPTHIYICIRVPVCICFWIHMFRCRTLRDKFLESSGCRTHVLQTIGCRPRHFFVWNQLEIYFGSCSWYKSNKMMVPGVETPHPKSLLGWYRDILRYACFSTCRAFLWCS